MQSGCTEDPGECEAYLKDCQGCKKKLNSVTRRNKHVLIWVHDTAVFKEMNLPMICELRISGYSTLPGHNRNQPHRNHELDLRFCIQFT